ncbi:MAG: hypothetical protein JO257_19700 [Deltaproteobacteria bacterium]|nr:hypothetical protein [Deltaproteobacteria bacterium]
MRKLLAIGCVALLGLLGLIWYQLHEPAEAAPAPAAKVEKVAAPPVSPRAQDQGLAKVAQQVAAADGKPQKVDPASDAFFYAFDDRAPREPQVNAATCYTGGMNRVHRNQKLKLHADIVVKDGEVTYQNVKVDPESTITDKTLVDCMVKEVGLTHWHDDTLPDYTLPADEILIRPERGMKKYTEENRNYQGDGPDFTGTVKKYEP